MKPERKLKTATQEQRRLFDEALDLLVTKVAHDEKTIGVEFPHVTRPDGSWTTLPASLSAGYQGGTWSHGNWTCGFWVGMLIAAYLRSKDQRFLVWARERMRLVAQRADDPNTHDIGFIFEGSAIPAFHVTQDEWFGAFALRAANKLRARLITTRDGAYISSWGPIADPRGRASSAIDTMANLPLLYWAARYAKDDSYRIAADAHAAKTGETFVRADHSTYHAVEYDPVMGKRLRGYTFQGYADESTWPRGQAWAIYGYVVSARETEKVKYLHLAEQLATYYLGRLQNSLIPPWDFDAPKERGTLRDSAAAAIAASALLDLGQLHVDLGAGDKWITHSLAMLEELCRDFLAREQHHRGLLKHGCYSKPHNEGVDSATMFGDFFFVEALTKVLLPGKFQPELGSIAA